MSKLYKQLLSKQEYERLGEIQIQLKRLRSRILNRKDNPENRKLNKTDKETVEQLTDEQWEIKSKITQKQKQKIYNEKYNQKNVRETTAVRNMKKRVEEAIREFKKQIIYECQDQTKVKQCIMEDGIFERLIIQTQDQIKDSYEKRSSAKGMQDK